MINIITLFTATIISSCVTSFVIHRNHSQLHNQILDREMKLRSVNEAIYRVEKSLAEMNEEMEKLVTFNNCNK